MIEQLRIAIRPEQFGQDVEPRLWELNSLREDLLHLDVEDVTRPAAGPAPPGARSSTLEQVNTLLVTLTAAPALLHQVVMVVEKWRGRASGGLHPDIVVTLGDQRLEVRGGDIEQQHMATTAFLEACMSAQQRGAQGG
ncbi:hypothetical protein ACFYYS_40440 [Streptomyces sp. NPDC002120]|uniref:hypothetical protein n=1 Tax=Streptomyces sp. NPDC002120 TaxID=3364631 RepID=UPI0036A86B56